MALFYHCEALTRSRCRNTTKVFVPLKIRKKNGWLKMMLTANHLPSDDQTQDPHILRAIGRAWGWRRRKEADEFSTARDRVIA